MGANAGGEMIARHQGALKMSQVVLRERVEADIQRMAQKAIEMQSADIAELRAWSEAHPVNPGWHSANDTVG